MSSVFDMFKQAPAAPVAAPAATPAAAPATNPTVPSDTTVPVAVDASGAPKASPLDKFADLWKNDPNAKPDAPFSFNSDPSKLMDTAKGVDFTKIVTPELQARIQAGGSDALAAMMEANNSMSQMAFAHSANAAAKITETALQAQEQRFKDMLPNLIKQHVVNDSFKQDNPLLKDPALAPMIGALQMQFTKQYPNATTGEIKRHVSDYLDGAADRITEMRPKPAEAKQGRPEQDWSIFEQ